MQLGRNSQLIEPFAALDSTAQNTLKNRTSGIIDHDVNNRTSAIGTSVTDRDGTSSYTTSQSDFTSARISQGSTRSSALSMITNSTSRFSETEGETAASAAGSASDTQSIATDVTSMDEETRPRRSRKSKKKSQNKRSRQQSIVDSAASAVEPEEERASRASRSVKELLKSKRSRDGAIVASEHFTDIDESFLPRGFEAETEQAADLTEENVDDEKKKSKRETRKKSKHGKRLSAALDENPEDSASKLTEEAISPETEKRKSKKERKSKKTSFVELPQDINVQQKLGEQPDDGELSNVASQSALNVAVENAISKVESLLASRLSRRQSSIVKFDSKKQEEEQLEESSEQKRKKSKQKRSKTKQRSSEKVDFDKAGEENLAEDDDIEKDAPKKKKSERKSRSTLSQQEKAHQSVLFDEATMSRLLDKLAEQQQSNAYNVALVDENSGEVIGKRSIDDVENKIEKRKSEAKKNSSIVATEDNDATVNIDDQAVSEKAVTAVEEDEQNGNDEKRKSRKSKRKSKITDDTGESLIKISRASSKVKKDVPTTSIDQMQNASEIQGLNLLDDEEKPKVSRRITFPPESQTQLSNPSVQDRSVSLYDKVLSSSKNLTLSNLREEVASQNEEVEEQD